MTIAKYVSLGITLDVGLYTNTFWKILAWWETVSNVIHPSEYSSKSSSSSAWLEPQEDEEVNYSKDILSSFLLSFAVLFFFGIGSSSLCNSHVFSASASLSFLLSLFPSFLFSCATGEMDDDLEMESSWPLDSHSLFLTSPDESTILSVPTSTTAIPQALWLISDVFKALFPVSTPAMVSG